MSRVAIQIPRFAPYHLARVEAAYQKLTKSNWEVVGLEIADQDTTYAWDKTISTQSWKRLTVFPDECLEEISYHRLRRRLSSTLRDLAPSAVCISGWGTPEARICLSWCRQNGVKAIVMSETREADGRRTWWKEAIKKRLVSQFDAGLVGARSHREYLTKLGIPSEKIHFGYNVVNNDYFAKEAKRFKHEDGSLKIRPYFQASNRFIERKNLHRLIRAFASFTENSSSKSVWNLCLLGDGPLMSQLKTQATNARLTVAEVAPWETRPEDQGEPTVFFPGFRQIEELPRFYAHAGCFVHPALEEPWGLVINEAMASGLPVLSSSNVGAAEELVIDGENGWLFNPQSTEEISIALSRVMSLDTHRLERLSSASQEILERLCPTSGFGMGLAKLLANL